MKENKPLDIKALLEEAKSAEHREAYKAMDRKPNFRIGIGVRLTSPNSPSFFVEILIYPCPTATKTDLRLLEKSLTCLKALQARNYSLTCQDSACISCEITVPTQKLATEYKAVKSMIENVFG